MLVVVDGGVGVVVGVCVCPSPPWSSGVEEEAEQCCSAMFECIFFFLIVLCVCVVRVCPQTSYTATTDAVLLPSCVPVCVGGCVWNEKGASIRRRRTYICLHFVGGSVKSE